ncbi:YggT family protein [Bacillaceae bacterium]
MKEMILSFAGTLLEIYYWILIARILVSWLPAVAEKPIGQWLYTITEPYLSPFRRIIPPIGGMLDISPILAFIVYQYLRKFVLLGLDTVLGWLGL